MPIIWRGTAELVEQADSPHWVFGDQLRLVRRFMGPHGACLASAPLKGALGGGIATGLRVAQSTVTRQKAGIGTLSIEYETQPGEVPLQGQQLPDDEAEITDDETEEQLKHHPKYKTVTEKHHALINTLLNTAYESTEYTSAFGELYADPSATLAIELLGKLHRGFTHYPEATPVYRLTLYFWERPTTLVGGNFRATPPSEPLVPPAGLDWIRKPDRLSHNGTHWVLVRRWQGYKDLDTDVYP